MNPLIPFSLVVCLLTAPLSHPAAAAPTDPPDIVIIMADDMGFSAPWPVAAISMIRSA